MAIKRKNSKSGDFGVLFLAKSPFICIALDYFFGFISGKNLPKEKIVLNLTL
jgi:hypothetical protein